MTMNENEPGRSAIEDLLPWHAAGTLSPREAAEVETALAADPELARRYDLVREEMAATIHLNETLGAPSPRAMSRLFAAIEAEGAPTPVRSRNLGGRVAAFFAGLTPRQLAYASAAAALVIALQAGAIGLILSSPGNPNTFHVASSGGGPTTAGTFAIVRFAPGATAAGITAFLAAHQASIVGGPTSGGLYRVQIATTRLSADERQRLVSQLSAETAVIGFIAPAD